MPVLNYDSATRWLTVNGWERVWATAQVWKHPDLTKGAGVSMHRAVELTMDADVARATIPEAR